MNANEAHTNSFQVMSIHVGRPKVVAFENQEIWTAIYKHPIEGPAFLSKTQLDGDAQADLKNHGGANKALCVYANDHYDEWGKMMGRTLGPGAFGENITVSGLTEDKVHIGDVFQFGEAVVQVSQPRQPCFKLANKMGMPEIIKHIQERGWSGYYLRVLKEGWISKNDRMTRTQTDPAGITVS
ncbi:MAG TPA: MOSC domain-containing protein, partial [Bacillales bacterium]|nr:MOSC domain-containing protein [Bacillales bacterium]